MNTAPTDNKTPKSRMKCDPYHESESTLLAVLLIFCVFLANHPQTLQTIADRNLVAKAVEIDLLTAEEKSIRSIGYVCGQEVVASQREKRAVFGAELLQNKYLTMCP